MSVYLDQQSVCTSLSLGRTIEQWLGTTSSGEYVLVKWISIEKWSSGDYKVCYFEAFDDGDIDELNLYEFELEDTDSIGGKIESFPDYETALNFAYEEFGCKADRFVNQGCLINDYKDYVIQRDKVSG